MNHGAARRPFWTRSAATDMAMTREDGWSYRVLKHGFPGCMGTLGAYVLTLDPGCVPHPVHNHGEEEILIPLAGAVDVLQSGPDVIRLSPGTLLFHPTGHQHTHRGASAQPAEFVVLKWSVPGLTAVPPDNVAFFAETDTGPEAWVERGGIRRRRVWERVPLAAGGHCEAEVIEMSPETGYPVHSHEHDLCLVLTQGRLAGLGHLSVAPAVIYYPAGTPHGAAPTNPEPLRMIAIEFHRPDARTSGQAFANRRVSAE